MVAIEVEEGKRKLIVLVLVLTSWPWFRTGTKAHSSNSSLTNTNDNGSNVSNREGNMETMMLMDIHGGSKKKKKMKVMINGFTVGAGSVLCREGRKWVPVTIILLGL